MGRPSVRSICCTARAAGTRADGLWMGWERKRGKLVDFNAFITGADEQVFATAEGDLPWLRDARYAITLDADTMLPRSAAAALIGTIDHPLNRAEYDAARGRVVRGYGILQPRVSVSLPSASESKFAVVYSGHPGVDPYTTAVSDVYQDLFGEGTFTGKGIYDVAVFRAATDGRFPENALLSHDLLEGTFARAGLVTDVEVFDDYPTRYLTSTRRLHRWIRGDWQLLRWLTADVPGLAGANRAPLSTLSRWKIADNMRRSTTPIALLLWLVAGLTVLPGAWEVWFGAVLAAFGAPWIVPLLVAATRPPRGQAWRPYYAAIARDGTRAVQQLALAAVLLPDQALLAADAITRTVVRVVWTKRNLLEWQTASHIEEATGNSRLFVWRRMAPAVVLGAAILALVAWRGSAVRTDDLRWWLSVVGWTLLAIGWLSAPETAIALSAPVKRRDLLLDGGERATAIRYAARHWRYFDRFVTAETNWLAPDNFQEIPEPVIATRTSPTNIGLQLLSTIAARDLGFLTCAETVDRLERAFDSIDRLPRVGGHFYNWYRSRRSSGPRSAVCVDGGFGQSRGAPHRRRARLSRYGRCADRRRPACGLRSRPRVGRCATDASGGAWVGEHLLAYQAAILDLRRHPGVNAPDDAADVVWARQRLQGAFDELTSFELDAEESASLPLRDAARTSAVAEALVSRLDDLATRARATAMAMDFRLVYEPKRRLFSIGYDARSGVRDDALYDLLASESRLASFVAIAKDDVPAEHWFHLGRSLTTVEGATALVSWSGTMFEYLMPLLVMPPRPFSLLDQTCHAAVERQMELRERARRAVGDLGVRVQRSRPSRDVSVPRVRRA